MAIRSVRRQATNPGAVSGTSTASPIYVDSDDNILKIIPASTGTTEVQVVDASSTQTLTNKTLTAPVMTNPVVTSAPVNHTTGTLTLVAATHAFKTVTLNVSAGCTIQLPAASGTGNKYRFFVGTTSATGYVFSPTGDDTLFGSAHVGDTGDSAAAIADLFHTAAGNNTVTGHTANGSGVKGSTLEFEDVTADEWAVDIVGQGAADPANPFSTV